MALTLALVMALALPRTLALALTFAATLALALPLELAIAWVFALALALLVVCKRPDVRAPPQVVKKTSLFTES